MIKILRLLSLLAFLILPLLFCAQPDPPAGGGPPCGPPFGPVCPIDGGITWLLAAGLIYGGKKVMDSRRKKIGA
ncbi:MAG: hypothetical protein SH856_13865 [Flavobacteriales bacterium]|nr:hypothetical protein [Flavobacteriales bacterium]